MWPQPGSWGQQQQQWPIQQSAYAHMAHDQVDWAALAKQWMQFRDAGAEANPPLTAPGPPPPSGPPPSGGTTWNGPVWNQPATAPSEESGAWKNTAASDWTADMDVEKEEELKNSVAIDYNHGAHSSKSYDSNHSNNSQAHTMDKTRGNLASHYNQGYDYKEQEYQGHHAPDKYWANHVHAEHGYNHYEEPRTPGTGPTHHGGPPFDMSRPPPGFPTFDRPPPAAMHHHQHHQPLHENEHYNPALADHSLLDAAKRKQLPAWIREGLEKMEREKAKKDEMEREAKLREERKKQEEARRKLAEEEAARTGIPLKSKFEDDEEQDSDVEGSRSAHIARDTKSPLHALKQRSRSPSPEEKYMTAEEKQEALLLKVKRMVTEVLLAVTNEEIADICETVYNQCKKKAKSAPAKMLAKSSALSSLTSSFGGYDSEISEDEASDSDIGRRSGSESDSENVMERRRQEFSKKQRERLRQAEHEEQQAMDIFMGAGKEGISLSRKHGNTIPGLEAHSDSHSPTPEKNAAEPQSSEASRRDHSDSKRSSRDDRYRESLKARSRSRSRDRKRSRSHERGTRKRSRDRKSRSHSRDRRSKRSRSRDQSRRERRSHRSRSQDSSRSRSRSREPKRKRSRSKDRKKERSRSYERRSKRSRSRDRDRKRKSRSRSREKASRRTSRHSTSHSRKADSDSEKRSRRSRSSSLTKKKSKRERSISEDSDSDSRKKSNKSSRRSSKTAPKKSRSSSRRDDSSDESSSQSGSKY